MNFMNWRKYFVSMNEEGLEEEQSRYPGEENDIVLSHIRMPS